MSTSPSAQLHVFGGVSLAAAGAPVSGRGAQRRRLALLAILASSQRPVSRDKVVGYLWEEADTERARKLLSESLYVLRKALGEDAIIASGDAIQLNESVVWSDVVEFRRAIQAQDDASAVAIYRGPFLDGFFVDDAVEFDNWVEAERSSLARTRAEALLRLAGNAETARAYAEAAAYWRMLAEYDRYSTQYALGLMRALDAAGDRPAALQHARIHAALLRSELDADPDPQVEAFARSLQSSFASVEPIERIAQLPRTAAPEGEKIVAGAVPQAAPSGRRSTALLAAGALALIAVVIAAVLVRRQGAPVSPTEAATVAVFPFSVHGAPKELREGIVDLLSTNLDGAGQLHAVDAHAVLAHFTHGDTDITPRQAQNLARQFGANYFVAGDIVQAGSQLQVSAIMYEAATLGVIARANTRGPADSLLLLVDRLSTQILSSRGVNAGELTQIAGYTTKSYAALKYYLDGDNLYRAGRYDAAAKSFLEAIRADPEFVLADYRLSASAEWNFQFLQARAAARRALANQEHLAEHYRPLVRAWSHFLNGNTQGAEREYETVLSSNPNSVEARAGLGEVLVHFNPPRGLPVRPAREAFERVLRLAPAYGEVRYHALEFAARDHQQARFDTLYTGLDTVNSQFPAWRAVRAFTFGNPDARARALVRIRSADELAIGIAAARLAAHTHNFTDAARIARELTTSNRSAQWHAGGYLLLAEIAVANGNWSEANAQLLAAASVERDWSRELSALFALHPEAGTETDGFERSKADLEAWHPDSHSPSLGFFLASHATIHKHLRLYLLALTSVKLGQLNEAERYRRELEMIGGGVESEKVALALSRSLAGHLAVARGDRAKAIELLESATIDAPPEFLVSPFYSRAHDRLVLGDLNRDLGRTSEARRWYESLLEGYDFVYAAAAEARIRKL